MYKKYFAIFLLLSITSCNRLKNDFFYFIFKTDDISVSRICSDNPSLFSEGRFFEVYSVSKEDVEKITSSVFQPVSSESINERYPKYKNPNWKPTPVSQDEQILQFVHTQMEEEKNECFDESTIMTVLKKEGNLYLPLRDNLGRIQLFVLDTKTGKLFLLTSYIL